MLKTLFVLLLLSFQHSKAYADSRLIIHLSDYLANDYAGAVSEEGEILSVGEYDEQVEFSQTALRAGQKDTKINQNPQLMKQLRDLNEAIVNKKGPSIVVPLARDIQRSVIQASGIALYPSNWPDYDKAQALFQQNCIQCHGPEGKGDGPDGVGLDPAPANFHDMERAPIVSPFAAFNTIRLGVPGTGMMAFEQFSDEEVWSLAFYVSSLRFGKRVKTKEALSNKIPNDELLKKTASLNDEELKEYALSKGETADLVTRARLYFLESDSTDYLTKAENLLNQSLEQFKSGNYSEAEKLSLDAYFLGIEPVENKIHANDPPAVTRIEEKMANFRRAIKTKDESAMISSHAALTEEIKELNNLLSDMTVTPTFAFASGFSIILREGFEAVLVIMAILGVAKAAGSTMVTASIHAGWIISLVLGVIGWYLSGILISMSGVSREIIEAVAAFFAVFVLMYVGFWMHRQTEIHRWKEFINVRVKNLTSTRNLFGLFILSFVVTFREVIETVLFLRTIYIDTAQEVRVYIFGGVLVAFTVVLIVSILITKFRNKIPLQKFFNLSSIIMVALAVILSGKGIHALQEAGIVSMHAFPLKLRSDLLGLFPSWETMIVQVVTLFIAIGLWKMAGRKNQKGAA